MITGLLLNSDITAVAAMKSVHYQAHLQYPNPPLGAIRVLQPIDFTFQSSQKVLVDAGSVEQNKIKI